MRSNALRSVHLSETGNSSFLNHEKEQALKSLTEDSDFQPITDIAGPYDLTLGIHDGRLAMDIKGHDGTALPVLLLSVKPYSRLVRDYFMLIESFEAIRRTGNSVQLEAVDMGRRGLHDEGATLLMERLEGKIALDHATARRLFTLICILHSQFFPVF